MKKRKSPHNYIKTPIDKFCEILMLSLLPFLVFICVIILLTTKSHASTVDNYFPMSQNYNQHFSGAINLIEHEFDAQNNYIFCIYTGQNLSQSSDYFTCLYYPKSYGINVYAEINGNGTQFSLYRTSSFNISYRTFRVYWRNGIEPFLQDVTPISQSNVIGVTWNSSYSTSSADYISNFRLYTNNTSNRRIVLNYSGDYEPEITIGQATPPEELQHPVYTQGHSKPENVPPTYTVNNYNWTTYNPPTIDDSGIIEIIKSEIQVINYLAVWLIDNFQGMFQNLISNIKGLIDYIGQTIEYYGNMIVETLNNLITTFYNNMVGLVQDIVSGIAYIKQPLDMDSLTNTVNSTQIWGDVDTCTDFADDAFGIYGTVAEPNNFKIPLDLRSISLLNITQVYYIDLSWLDGAKSAIRAFMWCVVTFGLLYSIIVDIPNMIRSSK